MESKSRKNDLSVHYTSGIFDLQCFAIQDNVFNGLYMFVVLRLRREEYKVLRIYCRKLNCVFYICKWKKSTLPNNLHACLHTINWDVQKSNILQSHSIANCVVYLFVVFGSSFANKKQIVEQEKLPYQRKQKEKLCLIQIRVWACGRLLNYDKP